MKLTYIVVFDQTPNNYCAYAPDVPGCFSTGKTWDHIQEMIREALTFHLEGLMEDGDPIPEPRMSLEDAMAHHCQPFTPEEQEALNKVSNDWPPCLSVTVAPIEVEVPAPQPVPRN